MGGFCGVVSETDCSSDLFFGTDYHSHLGAKRAGIAALLLCTGCTPDKFSPSRSGFLLTFFVGFGIIIISNGEKLCKAYSFECTRSIMGGNDYGKSNRS